MHVTLEGLKADSSKISGGQHYVFLLIHDDAYVCHVATIGATSQKQRPTELTTGIRSLKIS
jgi:hypothetical protein